MDVQHFVVTLNSHQPAAMIEFYEHIVGLTPNNDVTPGAFMAGSSGFVALIIEAHSDIEGPVKEPARVLLNFVVADLVSEQDRLDQRGVKFTRRAAEEPGYGLFATFLDPDGNCCQLVEFRQ